MNYKNISNFKKGVKLSFEHLNVQSPKLNMMMMMKMSNSWVQQPKCTSNPTQENLDFLSSHSRHCFTKLLPLKNWVVHMSYYDSEWICSILNILIHDDE